MQSQPTILDLTQLAILWMIYFTIHSWLASLSLKHIVATHIPKLAPGYRLIYNLLSLLLLIPPLTLMFHVTSEPLLQWRGIYAWLAYIVMGLACIGFLSTLHYYDNAMFLGLKQLRRDEENLLYSGNFILSPLHRYVRHPWYFLGLLVIWVQDMDAARLTSALLATGYLYLGSRLEERKMIRDHGACYAEYLKRVPGLIPLPWKYLSRTQAERIITSGS